VAVFTKYDVLVESLKPPVEEGFHGDIEKETEIFEKEVDTDIGLITGTLASQIDPHVLSLAEKKLSEMITPFEERLGIPWVTVSGLHILPFALTPECKIELINFENSKT
jgi:hypothetical protein